MPDLLSKLAEHLSRTNCSLAIVETTVTKTKSFFQVVIKDWTRRRVWKNRKWRLLFSTSDEKRLFRKEDIWIVLRKERMSYTGERDFQPKGTSFIALKWVQNVWVKASKGAYKSLSSWSQSSSCHLPPDQARHHSKYIACHILSLKWLCNVAFVSCPFHSSGKWKLRLQRPKWFGQGTTAITNINRDAELAIRLRLFLYCF